MKIDSISAVNLKCPSFSHELGTVTVLCGGNYAGKSARLEAIRLGLLGWLPGLPRTNAGIFSLSCGAQMGVTLRFSDGKTITRHYSQKGDSIKAVEMANGFTVPDVLMDATTYLQKSDRERVKYVFGLVDISSRWTGETILRTIGETPIDCSPDIIEAVVLAKQSIWQSLSDADMIRHSNDEPVQTWLETQLADLRERVKATTAALGRMEKFSQASVELKAADSNGFDAANVDRLIKEKLGQVQALREKIAVARERSEAARRNEAMRSELTRRMAEPFDVSTLDKLREQIKELGPKVQGHKSDTASLAGKVAEANGQLATARAMEKKIVSEITAVKRQHDLDMKAPACPHCGTKGKNFLEAVEEKFREDMARLEEGQKKTSMEIGIALKLFQDAEQAYKVATSDDQSAQQNSMILQSAKAELNRLETLAWNRELWQKQLAGMAAVEAPKSEETFELTKQIALIETELSDLAARQKRWIAAAQDAKRLAEAKARRVKDESELIALKAVVKSIEVIQAAMVADAFGAILADVNRFTNGILLTPLAYHEGEIGRWSGTNWIPHRSFSGTEQLVSMAGISVALARQSPVKIVLLDELGRLTTANKERLVDRLWTLAQEGFIDQAVCVDVSRELYAIMDWINLIEV